MFIIIDKFLPIDTPLHQRTIALLCNVIHSPHPSSPFAFGTSSAKPSVPLSSQTSACDLLRSGNVAQAPRHYGRSA